MRYLDPKADLTFKKIFGEHKDLLISLLNSLLPLPDDGQVTEVEYMTPEMVPETPIGRNSIVDVRCTDQSGRQFIVEMQTLWSPMFMQRVVFNASKAYVRQLDKRTNYSFLQPVYSLNLVNSVFLKDLPNEFIHNYNIVHELHSDKVINGLHLTFVELPKFKPTTRLEKRMAVLWLRFLTEIGEDTVAPPAELASDPLVSRALEQVETSAFSKSEMAAYDKFWDVIRTQNMILDEASQASLRKGIEEGLQKGLIKGIQKGMEKGMREGMEQGLKEGMEQGLKQGIQKGVEQGLKQGMEQGLKQGIQKGVEQGLKEGMQQGLKEGMQQGLKEGVLKTAAAMLKNGIPRETVAACTGLSASEIAGLDYDGE